ncbi:MULTISPECIES: bifunctional adenosylcobinamide kinase/adenosylcobinamide-phosphate guanylyltransferase [unclassified Synechocystis]|uniref:bifunctional adenosylcobinamide kinase/adenosylcobinamide-phosphate guanylyltransferase n=1 Tax=unclassified Synechocystis TaxID=2640012 RepID=UPI00048BE64A|nr:MULTISPECIES: bifunctional adenosylcobinamide kinase/adenosylcobinamide-phosphate guanylyltransferase [unclassified Synechocystis]AIE72708.1 Adenosylcobinamide-phosphate guanylyltransferase [Synechocystis sp. PCC 6714]MCT0254639.1 bifunctional adenosylcobinamide kinase/adenosylcobinamide-phosphate guanylyltransferase [Synechocystis sp. CS-94]
MPLPILVTGPSRSGKSEWAEHLASKSHQPVIYIATGKENAADADWQNRIQQHRNRRPSHWKTVCVDQNLTDTLTTLPSATCALVDSLGGWVANTLELSPEQWQTQQRTLINFVQELQPGPGLIIFVAEETGWGVIPAYALGRIFRDRLGALTRQLGGLCGQVYLVTGGYALDLRRWGEPLPPSSQ